MALLSHELFSRILTPDSARQVIECHLDQRVTKIEDETFLGLGFDMTQFMELLRDRLWRSENEIEFFLNDRKGRSKEAWSSAIQPSGVLTLDALMRLKAQKTSIYVHSIDRMVQPIRELVRDMTATGYFAARVYAMYSPANAHSTPKHVDPTDVIAMQLHGSKDWLIDTQPKIANLMPGTSMIQSSDGDFIEPAEYSIAPGEAMFIPRGFLHHAKSSNEDSLHLVVALQPLTWMDVMENIAKVWAEQQPELRASVLAADTDGEIVSSFAAAAELFANSSDAQFVQETASSLMKERAQKRHVTEFGQLFAKAPDDLL
ncbi:cupin domain-containing protein [uncultured Erythrobacter sp.]|uniref:JmjC domain-containing protein n=1 Tax=uncultured Erythrobacter sp. TaxID=263913 RepID=UPI00261F63B1|nr:cupin domain-containing protein [uncultured Erythrobacter sp.]